MARFLRFATLAAFFLVLLPSVALAQEVDLETANPDYDDDQIQEYLDAITNCDTPSLECLVHYTSRYIAIEWLSQAVGKAGTTTAYPSINSPGTDSGAQLPGESSLALGSENEDRGVIGALNNLIAQMYVNQPADTATFVADVMNSAGFAQPAYAQGLGFASLNPVLDLWKVFRNIAYTFFVVIFIVIGFMIMFRTKISGNAAVTAQQAIPSIITSLIFVTFSYAIAGLLIDGMYLSMFLILGIFGDTLANTSGMEIINYNILTLAGKLFTSTGFSPGALDRNLNVVEVFLDAFTDNPLLNNGAVEFVGGLLVSLIVAIASLIATFKLFFELLKSYASIIINVVLAPVLLMMGAIPGKNAFTPWVKNMIGNLIAFPTVLLVLVIFYQFVGATGEQRFEEGGFMPPFLLGRGQADIIATLMGFALLLALPEVVKKAKESFGAKGGFGEMVAGAAAGRAKQAWSGKMPLGLNAKNIAGGVASMPIRAAAGYAGYRMADKKAEELGYEGNQRKLAGLGGALAGATIGPKIPGLAVGAVKQGAKQVAQIEVTKQWEDFTRVMKARRAEIRNRQNANLEHSQEHVTPAPSLTTGRSLSDDQLEGM